MREVWRDIDFDVMNVVGRMIDVYSEGTETAGMLDRLGLITVDVNACDAARMIPELDDLDMKIDGSTITNSSALLEMKSPSVKPILSYVEVRISRT